MLVNNLNIAQKQSLAKEIRRLIEPKDKASLTTKIKETQIRRFLKYQKNVMVSGISDIISILESNYAPLTIDRLLSKIQSPIVWDTCIARLPIGQLIDWISNTKQDIIITTSMYDELMKLLNSDKAECDSIESARFIAFNILLDDNSDIFTLVNLPKEDYVDNQLLNYCENNKYELYTYDYSMGLRARSRKINVTIFNDIDKNEILLYQPNPSGKNVVLSTDLLNSLPLDDVLKKACLINANKFILTRDFVEELEKHHNTQSHYRDYIRFFVYDECGDYSIYVSPDEENCIDSIVQKYDALVFSADPEKCMNFKANFIPYKIIYNSSIEEIMNKYSIFSIKTDDIAKISISDTLDISKLSTELKTPDDLTIKKPTNLSIIIPFYKPKTHNIPVKNIPTNESVWVLDEEGCELNANIKRGFDAYPGYTVIHVKKIRIQDDLYGQPQGMFQLTAYKIINEQYTNYGYVVTSIKFSSNDLANVPKPYLSYAKRSLLLM